MKLLKRFSSEIECRHYESLNARVEEAISKIKDVVNFKDSREKAYYLVLKTVGSKGLLVGDICLLRRIVKVFNKILPKGDFLNRKSKEHDERFDEITSVVRSAFSYECFRDTSDENGRWGGWALAKEFNKALKYCPYCNAETLYAFEWKEDVTTLKMAKSAFDHYFPRARYPFLGLSLYNLIPSCTRCNTAFKGAVSEGLLMMAHPFIDDMDAQMRFHALVINPALAFQGDERGLDGVVLAERKYGGFNPGVRWERTFKVSESYSALYRQDVALALARAQRFPKAYVEMISRQLKEQKLPVGDLEAQFYGVPLDKAQINLHRHSKLIIDLAEEFRCV